MLRVNNLAGFGRRRGGGSAGFRYFRVAFGESWHDKFHVNNLRFSEDGGVTTFPPNMTDYDAPAPWVVSSNSEDTLSDTRFLWMACDDHSAEQYHGWRTINDSGVYFQLDAGAGASLNPNYLYLAMSNNNAATTSTPKSLEIFGSNTGAFLGEEVSLHSEPFLAELHGLGNMEATFTW